MAVTFPPSPVNGQTVTDPATGAVWTWNGTAWVPAATAGTFPTVPQVQSMLSVNTGRNYVHNGTFNIQQRGSGSWTTNAAYTADRWLMLFTSDTMSLGLYGLADADRAAIGDESAIVTAVAQVTGTAGGFSAFSHKIESARRLSGKTITVSFWAKLNSGGAKLGVSLDQWFGSGGSPSAGINNNGQSVTLTSAFQRYSLTFTLASTAGITFGTNNNDYTQLNFWFSSGTANAARAGNIGVQTNSVALWGVQLELGSGATPFEHRDVEIEYDLCRRFYQSNALLYQVGYGLTGQGISFANALSPVMRSNPTVTVPSPSYTNVSGTPSLNAQPSAVYVNGGITVTATGAYTVNMNTNCSADL